MSSQISAIKPEFRDGVGAFEFEENSLSSDWSVNPKMFPVPTDATPVARYIVYGVLSVPSVWQIDRLQNLNADAKTMRCFIPCE